MQTASQSHVLDSLIPIESWWGHSLHYEEALLKGWTARTSRETKSHLSLQRHATHWASFRDCDLRRDPSTPCWWPPPPSAPHRVWPCLWPTKGQSTQAITMILRGTSFFPSQGLPNSYGAVKQGKPCRKMRKELKHVLKRQGIENIVCHDNGCTLYSINKLINQSLSVMKKLL